MVGSTSRHLFLKLSRYLLVIVPLMLLVYGSSAALPCGTLGGTVTKWIDSNGNWNNAANWDNGVPANPSFSACIVDGSSTVALNMNASIYDLQLAGGNILNINPSTSLTINGTQILNAGLIDVHGGGGTNSYLYLPTSVSLSGGGVINLTTTTTGGGGSAWLYLYNGSSLTNVDNVIQGEGTIWNNGTTINNGAAGVINANSTGGPLVDYIDLDYGQVNNQGLLTATNNGRLALRSTSVYNAGGNITVNGAGATVGIYNSTVYGGTLNQLAGFLGTPSGYSATLDGSTGAGQISLNGTYTSDYSSSTYLLGAIGNFGNFQASGGGGANTYFYVPVNTTLFGGGTVTLSTTTSGGGGNAFLYLYNGATLDNFDNIIQGEGVIYNNGTTLINHAGGTINANSSGSPLINTLTVQYGSVENQGLMEATNAGVLSLDSTTVSNAGGTIMANGPGASVWLRNSSVYGGTLDNNGGLFLGTPSGYYANLYGDTFGPVTLNGTYTSEVNSTTRLYGSIINNNNILVNGGAGNNTYLQVPSSVTLSGGGTVSLYTTTSGGGGNAWLYLNGGVTLDNIDNTIQGEGILYANGATFNNHSLGVVNANSSGSPLVDYLMLQYGMVNNQGLLEATGTGRLVLNSVVANNAGGGVIAANGAGASVQVINSTTLQGGLLNNNGGAFFGTPSGNAAYLDGSSGAGPITLTGTYTSDFNSSTYLYGPLVNTGDFQLNGGAGTNSYYNVPNTVTLTGGGTMSLMTTTAGGGGNAFLQLYGGAVLNNVDNWIQGEGILYMNGATLNNLAGGRIQANSSGAPLVDSLTLQYGQVNNAGVMEAVANGRLVLNQTVVNNAGGMIRAVGPGASVQLVNSTTLQGGTLANLGGAFFGTPGGHSAALDGSSGAGPITVVGTYTTDFNSNTYLYGTLNNTGDLLAKGGAGTNTYFFNTSNVILTGGGTLSLYTTTAGGGGSAYLYNYGGKLLDNVNNTIQGEGVIYNSGATLFNEVGGTILANSTGAPLTSSLTVYYGTVTNNGTLQVAPGNLLHLYNGTLTNFSGTTLSGGTYNIYSGTLQVDSLGSGGGEIVNNAANILLDGTSSSFVDANGKDALSNLTNNSGSFTIQNGRNFTAPAFYTSGWLTVGAGSTFSTSGAFNQNGGYTKLDGGLTPGSGTAVFNGGTLMGNGGVVNGNVTMSGTLSPGDNPSTAGALQIIGNYVQTAAGIFQLDIGGTTAGSQFDFLKINGQAFLDGTLDIFLINGFVPSDGQTFTFLVTDPGVFGTFATVNGLNYGNGYFSVIYNTDTVELGFHGNQGPVPEPGTFLMLGTGLVGAAAAARRRWLR